MKKDFRYIGILVGVVLIFIAIEIFGPKPIDWTVTFSPRDKNPFGSFLISERLPDLFEQVEYSNATIYELQDSLKHPPLILTRELEMDSIDAMSLLHYVHEGGSAFIASTYYSGFLSDTLNVGVTDYLFEDVLANLESNDSTFVQFSNPQLNNRKYPIRIRDSYTYFDEFIIENSTVLANNDEGEPVYLKVKFGKGEFFLSTTPLAFTNNYLLAEENNEYISQVLSHLPKEGIHWTEYYYLGRIEPGTPLRYILSDQALKWSYYLLVTALIIFMLFESKRTQRIIPLITPLKNSTLEFVSTLGNLYYSKSNHKNIAEKRIAYFYQQLNENYFFHHSQDSEEFTTEVAQKTGYPEETTNELFKTIRHIRNSATISEEALLKINTMLDEYKLK